MAAGSSASARYSRRDPAPSDLGALAVRRTNDGLDAAAHPEVAHDLDPARRSRRHEVVEDAVRHVLVEGALVAIGPDVELDALELHQTLVRDVAHADGREVGLARLGAETGELGDLEGDLVVAIRMRIGHHLQLTAREARHEASLLPRRPGWTRPPHRVARPLEGGDGYLLEEDDARAAALHDEAAPVFRPRHEALRTDGRFPDELGMTSLHRGLELLGEPAGRRRARHDHAIGDGEAAARILPDTIAIATPSLGGAE